MHGWQVKLCDPLVTHGPYLSALEIKGVYSSVFFILLYFFTDRQRQTDKWTTIPGPLNVADTQLIIMTQYNSHTESILDCPIKP